MPRAFAVSVQELAAAHALNKERQEELQELRSAQQPLQLKLRKLEAALQEQQRQREGAEQQASEWRKNYHAVLRRFDGVRKKTKRFVARRKGD